MLGRRALNRALLERQFLLRRRKLSVPDTIERLVGMQAQVPRDPYVGLWSRVIGFRPEKLAELMSERRTVRMGLLRSTLHLVTARDALSLRPVLEPVIQRVLHSQSPFGRRLAGLDVDELTALATELLEERPRTRAELGPVLAERWPDHDAASLSYAVTYLLPLVQVTPRGIWGQTGPSAFTTVQHWLGRPLQTDPSPDEMILRYLRAFGPATVADVQSWSGLTGVRAVIERLRPGLRTFRDESGRELFDVPGAPLPHPDLPAPPRFLPEYDNIGLGHADRSRIIAPEMRGWIEIGWGSVLVDGFGSARWKVEREGDPGTATLRIEPFKRMTPRDREAVSEEGAALLAFLAADADAHDVRFEPPP